MPRIEFDAVEKRYGSGPPAVQHLDLALEDGEFLCLLGPSGCGKSSTLRMLAGLEAISAGEIRVAGKRINETPPQHRDMAMVFENYALYPHLTVSDNLAMPLAARGLPRAEIRQRVAAVAETLQITAHLKKRPGKLSGGERQRVGLGRAIIRTPKVFLMDEPLGHLEAYLRVQLRAEVRRLHERLGVTTLYITHDQEEAAAVSDRIAVMQAGELQQTGLLDELLDHPVNRFVAAFIGDLPINLCPARLATSHDRPALELAGVSFALSPPHAARLDQRAGQDNGVEFGIRPRDVRIVTGAEPSLAAQVAVLEPLGDHTVVICDSAAGRFSCLAASEFVPAAGNNVRLGFAMERAQLFDRRHGHSLLNGRA